MKCKIDGCKNDKLGSYTLLCKNHLKMYADNDCTPSGEDQFIASYNSGYRVMAVWAKRYEGEECLCCGNTIDEMPNVIK